MNKPRRYRLLSDEEVELWRRVAETVAPRPGSILPVARPAEPAQAPPPQTSRDEPNPPRVRTFAAPSYTPPQPSPGGTLPPLAPLERQFRKKVARGRIDIGRVIDLHGLNQAQAHGALRSFLRSAQADGLRLVLVVTGKGGGSGRANTGEGVLRRAVPHWLREADLRATVLGFEEASLPHGGAGALYIRLRATRA